MERLTSVTWSNSTSAVYFGSFLMNSSAKLSEFTKWWESFSTAQSMTLLALLTGA